MNIRPELHSVAIELTAHCNQKCDYCYNGWRADDGASMATATTEQLLARVDKLIDAFTIDHVTLTGGEPFSRPDIWELLDRLKERGVPAQIISNGGLITERIAERLAPYNVRYVQVTLNGPTRELHEEHVGPGHFEPTLRGVRALRKHGVPVVGCIVVTRKNAPVLGDILELWRSLGVEQIALSRFSPAGYAVSHAAQLLPTLDDMQGAFEQAHPFARDRGMHISCTMPIPPCMIDTSALSPIVFGYCPIGTNMQEVALGPDGKLKNCTLHAAAIGGVTDILDPSVDLTALLKHPDVTAYRKKLPAFCEGCVHADTCGGGCGAASVWMLGDADKRRPDPFLWQHVDDNFEARIERERAQGRRRLELIA
jgi:radical SAM protein with 4Fe4S-binding SPASM domain